MTIKWQDWFSISSGTEWLQGNVCSARWNRNREQTISHPTVPSKSNYTILDANCIASCFLSEQSHIPGSPGIRTAHPFHLRPSCTALYRTVDESMLAKSLNGNYTHETLFVRLLPKPRQWPDNSDDPLPSGPIYPTSVQHSKTVTSSGHSD